MPRPITRLAVDRMTDRALRRAARDLATMLRDQFAYTWQKQAELADELVQVLDELEMRGQQLQLVPPADQPA